MGVRITQAPLDVAELATSAKGRITQAVLDVGQLPTTAKVRITQLSLDVAIGKTLGQSFEEDGFMVAADCWM